MPLSNEVLASAHRLHLDSRLFESSPDCVKLLSCDGRVLAMNENGLCAMEIDEFAEYRGAPWTSFWPSDSHDQIESAIADAIRGSTGHFLAFCPTAKGAPKWWDVVVTLVTNPQGELPGLLAVSRDVTSTHVAQTELQAAEARMRALVMATNAITWYCSAAGLFETRQVDWAEFTGQPLEGYLHTGWHDAVHPADRAATLASLSRGYAGGSAFHLEHRLRRADGAYRDMRAKVVPIADAKGIVVEWVGAHTDITSEMKATKENDQLVRELQAANDRLNDIFRQAPAFICVLHGADHRFELTNDRYLQLIGNRDVVGQKIRDALPEISGQGFFELLDGVYQTGEPFFGFDMPVMLQRQAGLPLEQRYLDLVYMALRDADGHVTGLLAHGVDQTHRKLAERALQASRERFEKIVSQAATGVVEMDISGRIVFVNQRYAEMLGYASEQLIGLNALDITAPDSRQATSDTIAKLLDDGIGAALEKNYIRQDGSLMPATSSVNALRGPDGAFHGLVAIVLDMTESKRAINKLRASEERYRTLFESMDQGFCIIDVIMDGAGRPVDYRFVEMNPMFEEHTGIIGAVGRTALEIVPDLERFWIDTYGKVASTGESIRFENQAGPIQRWFDVYATRIGSDGSTRVALLFTDITARKHASDTLRRLAADLSEADRRKTEFLATLAHELRNPLAPIRNGLNVIRLSSGKPDVTAKVHAMIERQVGHMVHLIDDLLDIARISGGKLQLKKAHVELAQVIASAIETSLPIIESSRHALHIEVPPAGFRADIDFTRIAQVVANLLNNAAKYTPAGGRIELRLTRDSGDAVVTVSDSGIGIPADALASVFEMFSQVGASIDRTQGGLGIGLSLVRRLVEMHGGSVTVTSPGIGKGSTFSVRLPLIPLQDVQMPGLPMPVSDSCTQSAAGMPVLIVDDNVDAAMTLAMILELNGCVTRVAHDGIQALKVIEDFTPRLAFVDIGMPRMNGYETAVEMRRLLSVAQLNLVALTGWGAEGDRERSKLAGFDHHLTKPVQLSDIEHILAGLR